MPQDCKVREAMGARGSGAFRRYRAMVHGDVSPGRVLRDECIQFFCGATPGALGFYLRSKLYPRLFKHCGRGVVFGRNLTLRHASKISIGDGCVLDDSAMLDAKGQDNRGITLGDRVYVGRQSIVYCKNGDITLGDRVNLSANCVVFSSNSLTMKPGTMVGAFTYLLSGGSYDYADATPFADQSGMVTQGPLVIGEDCWIGARVTVLDAASIGDRAVVGAGAVVNKPLPARHLCVGVPARPIRPIA
ncbi:MAG: DapH/DapD/GlmU-related protein [Kiritimatiellia bacterium]|jgi:acetyltransferase-like isoleucine patch superfamily enzyme